MVVLRVVDCRQEVGHGRGEEFGSETQCEKVVKLGR